MALQLYFTADGAVEATLGYLAEINTASTVFRSRIKEWVVITGSDLLALGDDITLVKGTEACVWH